MQSLSRIQSHNPKQSDVGHRTVLEDLLKDLLQRLGGKESDASKPPRTVLGLRG